ncbi:MAG: hypothetical protein K0S35_3849 [Geminicoccaceae bacterium]|nr:hypothetical protein [Geminicoccaceae bacterium]
MHIGCPADDEGLLAAGIDPAEAEPLGVRVGAHLGDHGDPEGRQIGAAALDRLDLEAEHGELGDDLVQARLGREMLEQPGQGELHRDSPPWVVGTSSAEKP